MNYQEKKTSFFSVVKKINLHKETMNLIRGWFVLLLIWAFGTKIFKYLMIANDAIKDVGDYFINAMRGFLLAMLVLIPCLQIIQIHCIDKSDKNSKNGKKDIVVICLVLIIISSVIMGLNAKDVLSFIVITFVFCILNFLAQITFGKEVWKETGGLWIFIIMLLVNSFIALMILYLAYNPIKLLIFILLNLLILFLFNRWNKKHNKVQPVNAPIVLTAIITINIVLMVLLFEIGCLDDLCFNCMKKIKNVINMYFLYSLYIIGSYYFLSSFMIKEYFDYHNRYISNKIYPFQAMNNLFNYIVLLLLVIILNLFKIGIIEHIQVFANIKEFIMNNIDIFESFKYAFVEAIQIVLICMTYIALRKEYNNGLENKNRK